MKSPKNDPCPRPYVLGKTDKADKDENHPSTQLSWEATLALTHFDRPGVHELESRGLPNLTPEPVLPIRWAGEGIARAVKISDPGEGQGPARRQGTPVNGNTGVGVPKRETLEKRGNLLWGCVPKKNAFLVWAAISGYKGSIWTEG